MFCKEKEVLVALIFLNNSQKPLYMKKYVHSGDVTCAPTCIFGRI